MRIEFFTSQVTGAVGRKARPQFDLRIERYFLANSLFIFFGKLVFSFLVFSLVDQKCARGFPTSHQDHFGNFTPQS